MRCMAASRRAIEVVALRQRSAQHCLLRLQLAKARLDRAHLPLALLDQAGSLDQAGVQSLALDLELAQVRLEPCSRRCRLVQLLAVLFELALGLVLGLGVHRGRGGNGDGDRTEQQECRNVPRHCRTRSASRVCPLSVAVRAAPDDPPFPQLLRGRLRQLLCGAMHGQDPVHPQAASGSGHHAGRRVEKLLTRRVRGAAAATPELP